MQGQMIKFRIVIPMLVLAVVWSLAIGNATPAEAQSPPNDPISVPIVLETNAGEVSVTWQSVDGANFYRIGWLSVEDYSAALAEGTDWLEAFNSVSMANDGEASHTITRLTEGAAYWFIVGSSAERYGNPAWSPWSDPVTLSGGPTACAGDRAALTALYNATDGPNWRNEPNWLDETVPLDEWFGVSTDNHGCVLSLYLPSNDLSGEIPAEVADMPRLRLMHLSSNELTGEIPPELAGLGDLRTLNLWNNELTGEIPPELGGMTNLIRLDLGRNELTGEIPTELTQLTNLRVLSFNNNMLSGEMPPELGAMTGLTSLGLWENELTGEIPPPSWAIWST